MTNEEKQEVILKVRRIYPNATSVSVKTEYWWSESIKDYKESTNVWIVIPIDSTSSRTIICGLIDIKLRRV